MLSFHTFHPDLTGKGRSPKWTGNDTLHNDPYSKNGDHHLILPGNAVWVGAKLPRHDFLAARPLVAAEPEAFLWTKHAIKGDARVYVLGWRWWDFRKIFEVDIFDNWWFIHIIYIYTPRFYWVYYEIARWPCNYLVNQPRLVGCGYSWWLTMPCSVGYPRGKLGDLQISGMAKFENTVDWWFRNPAFTSW